MQRFIYALGDAPVALSRGGILLANCTDPSVSGVALTQNKFLELSSQRWWHIIGPTAGATGSLPPMSLGNALRRMTSRNSS